MWIIIIILLFVSGCAIYQVGKVMWYPNTEVRKQEQEDLKENYYQCLRLSMLPVESLGNGDIEYFTGIATKEVSYCFSNLKDINAFLKEAYSYQEALSTVYLYLDPIELGEQYLGIAGLYGDAYIDYLVTLMSEHPETTFECVLPAYSVDYWQKLSAKERENVKTYYIDFYNVLEGVENAKIYYLGFEEWLIANSANYIDVDERSLNTDVNRVVIAFVIRDDSYLLTKEKLLERLDLTEQISMENARAEKYDLSEVDVVFFGDSVFGNYQTSTSIPGVVNGLSGARVYNLALGGMPATTDGTSILPFEHAVERFVEGNVEGLEAAEFVGGMQQYLDDDHDERKQYFVVNYGINDYFKGYALDNPENELDSACYAGALRSGIKRLQESYPDATILIMVSNFVTKFNNGTDPRGVSQAVMEDYVCKAIEVADECGVEYLDIYFNSEINAETASYYLEDECHPGERGRFLLGKYIVQKIHEMRELR